MKRFAIALLALALFVPGLWIVAVTDDMILRTADQALAARGIGMQVSQFRKGLFFNFSASGVKLSKSERELLEIRRLDGSMAIASALLGKPEFRFRGGIGEGTLEGAVGIRKKTTDFAFKGVNISILPIVASMGVRGSGMLSGKFSAAEGQGNLTFDLAGARLDRAEFAGVPVPLELFHTAQGAVEISGNSAKIVSFTLQGNGVFARVKGDIAGSMLTGTIEIMPDKNFEQQNFLFAALANYKVSDGYYVIPLSKSFGY